MASSRVFHTPKQLNLMGCTSRRLSPCAEAIRAKCARNFAGRCATLRSAWIGVPGIIVSRERFDHKLQRENLKRGGKCYAELEGEASSPLEDIPGNEPTVEAETVVSSESIAPDVNVKFQLQRRCAYGERFHLVGSIPALGSWDAEAALPMTWREGDTWIADLFLPAAELSLVNSNLEAKFILKAKDKRVVAWQPGENRVIALGSVLDVSASPPSSESRRILVEGDWDNPDVELAFFDSENGDDKPIDETEGTDDTSVGQLIADGSDNEALDTSEVPELASADEEASKTNGAASTPVDLVNTTQNGRLIRSKTPPALQPTADVLQRDQEWSTHVWQQLLGTWGRKTLMEEEASKGEGGREG